VAHRPGRVVYNGEDLRLPTELARFGGELPVLAVNGPGTFHVAAGPDGTPWFCRDSEPMFPRNALPLVGRHNAGNLCVALGVFESIGIDCMGRRDAIVAALTTFVRPPHRLAPIEDPSGITFVNDSISTIPESTIHAIEAYADRPLTVILGGQDRNLDYSTLRAFLEDRAVAATVIGIPDSGRRILGALDGLPMLSLLEAPDLVSAVRLARACTPPGGAVLLSPAAPAYGHFDNFEHRAKVFLQAIADTRSDTQAVAEPL
jgi:UDP-N-acetylmuramoylalanine--D-glutamate ligase